MAWRGNQLWKIAQPRSGPTRKMKRYVTDLGAIDQSMNLIRVVLLPIAGQILRTLRVVCRTVVAKAVTGIRVVLLVRTPWILVRTLTRALGHQEAYKLPRGGGGENTSLRIGLINIQG